MTDGIEESKGKSTAFVAVVDDDESMREATESLLKSVGFRTAIFASAHDFLKAGGELKPDCLILDVRMPGMSGIELQKRLIAENRDISIVFLSAHSERGSREKALAAGAIDFLAKPFNEDSLLKAVKVAIERKEN
ncbi:MAG: response regulator [Acidobacteria bacterium]|nr:response regulator [Acidobacteriota bacterium]